MKNDMKLLIKPDLLKQHILHPTEGWTHSCGWKFMTWIDNLNQSNFEPCDIAFCYLSY